MKRNQRPYYIVSYGPNEHHMIDAKVFDKLTDANAFVKSIPVQKSYKLERHTPDGAFATGDHVKVKIVSKRLT